MATEVTDILSLADAKLELQADDGIPDVDRRITRALKAAVGYVEKETGIPLLEQVVSFDVSIRANDIPAILPRLYIKSIDAVLYWQKTQEMREEPQGVIPVESLGRMKADPYKDWTLVWPPADGWPVRLNGSQFRFTVTRSYELDSSKDEHLLQGIILLLRHFHDQPERFESEFAVLSLIRAWKS